LIQWVISRTEDLEAVASGAAASVAMVRTP
jgi:hypothetical protein